MRFVLLLGLLAVLASPARAQAVGSCETGTAQRFLENSQLRASVFNTGGLFFGGSTTRGDGYLIPKRDEVSPVFAATLWLGGRVEGELRMAAARYGSWDFWPGPLEDAASPPVDCSDHDRIYVVSRDDIRRYYQTGELATDLREWPHQLGAPVLDGDGDTTNYNLEGGDEPDLIGDMAAWWVMHDAGNGHGPSSPNGPLGVEVRVQAFVYGGEGVARNPALTQTTFYRYEIINRGRQPIEEMYSTMWTDPDLGDAGDDYIGTDTLRNLLFVYNSSNEDALYGGVVLPEEPPDDGSPSESEPLPSGPPPAWGVQVLEGPVGLANGRDDDYDGAIDEAGERLRATSTILNIDGGPSQVPGLGAEGYHNLMRGLWQNGTPLMALGLGFETGGPVTPFIYPGDPVTESFWSEMNLDGEGADGWMRDRRALISTGPFRLPPGASTTLLYAMPFARGTSHLQSVAELRDLATVLQSARDAGAFEGAPPVNADIRQVISEPVRLSRAQPNPASGSATVLLTLPTEARVRAAVYDALGRQLELVVDGVMPEGDNALAMPEALSPGTYLLRVQVTPGAEETLTFTVVR